MRYRPIPSRLVFFLTAIRVTCTALDSLLPDSLRNAAQPSTQCSAPTDSNARKKSYTAVTWTSLNAIIKPEQELLQLL